VVERDGIDMRFVNDKEFNTIVKRGAAVFPVSVHDNKYLYNKDEITTALDSGKRIFMIIAPEAVPQYVD
jgi:guanylate kinase